MMMSSIIAELCVYILTWNVGTHHPHDISLHEALSLNGSTSCPNQQLPDIYAIALQEVKSDAQNQFINIFKDNPWTMKVAEHLGTNLNYVKLDTQYMQGLLIMLFVQAQHVPHIKSVETESTPTGFGGLWGNKGAVSVRMSLYGTGVTFVGAHLAAHDSELKERIEDYNQIVEKHHYKLPNYRNIFDHDFVFWFGDLNFRLTGDDSAWDVRGMVEQGKLEELFDKDQLLLVRETGNAFNLMQEEKPKFAPTFKFVEGSSDYDLKRRPAWCDRILHRVQADKYSGIKLSIQQLSYRSHPSYTLSDHKPVSAEFIYKVATDTHTDEELHEMTHGGAAVAGGLMTPLASVIMFITAYLLTIS